MDELEYWRQRREGEEAAEIEQLRARLDALRAILSDPVNQLEQTKGGYYIYRFNVETMHAIADAIGIPKAEPQPFMATYTLEELTRLIK